MTSYIRPNTGKLELQQTFIASKNLTRPLISHLYFHHKYRIGINWDENGKLFLYKNDQVITHIIRSSQIHLN